MKNGSLLACVISMLLVVGAVGSALVFFSPWLYGTVQHVVEAPMYETNTLGALSMNNHIVAYRFSMKQLPEIDEMSDAERSHLRDVKKILRTILFLGVVGAGVLVYHCNVRKKALYLNSLYRVHQIRLWVGVAVFFLSAGISFSLVFEYFHVLFFAGNWQFSYESLLIQLYPEQFFIVIGCVLRLLLVILPLCVIWCFLGERRFSS